KKAHHNKWAFLIDIVDLYTECELVIIEVSDSFFLQDCLIIQVIGFRIGFYFYTKFLFNLYYGLSHKIFLGILVQIIVVKTERNVDIKFHILRIKSFRYPQN